MPRLPLRHYLCFVFIRLVKAGVTTFQPKCTIPQENTNLVQAPDARGTSDIIWASLLTIIACTYSVLHLDLPKIDASLRHIVQMHIFWAMGAVLAPEWLLMEAFEGWYWAYKQLKRLHSEFPATKGQWTMTHMLYADMGGFVFVVDPLEDEDTDADNGSDRDVEEMQPIVPKDPEAQQDNESTTKTNRPPIDAVVLKKALEKGWVCPVQSEAIRKAVTEGWLPIKPPIHENEIMDKSKGNVFDTSLVIFQLCYFCINLIGRQAANLAISQLEVGTAAFTVCSILTYALSFQKPKGVTSRMILWRGTKDEWKKFWDLHTPVLSEFGKAHSLSFTNTKQQASTMRKVLTTSPQDRRISYISMKRFELSASVLVLAITASLFGGVHLAAWNYSFPTIVDQWLWRVSALSTIAFPLLNTLLHMLLSNGTPESVSVATVMAYVVVRVITVVEMVRCLFYLPPDAFRSNWSANLPGFS